MPVWRKWTRSVATACLLGVIALLGAVTDASARSAPHAAARSAYVRIGSAPKLPAGTQPLAGIASAERLRVTVTLVPRNAAASAPSPASKRRPNDGRQSCGPKESGSPSNTAVRWW